MSRDKQLWKRMREKRKEEKRKAAQREEEERWRQEQEVASLRRQARAHESHLRHTEEARVKALMRGEAARSQSTAEQILKHGPKQAIFLAGLVEWDEDDKAGEPPGFRRHLAHLTRGQFWNQPIVWARGGGGGDLTPMQNAEAQREDYKRRLSAWKRMDRLWIQSRQLVRDMTVPAIQRAETASCYPLLAKPRAGLQLQSKNPVPVGWRLRRQHSNRDPPTSEAPAYQVA